MGKPGRRHKKRARFAIKPVLPQRYPDGNLLHGLARKGLLLACYAEAHCEWLAVTGYAVTTVLGRRHNLYTFAAWAEERGLTDPREITRPILQRYQRHLFYHRKADGGPLTAGTQLNLLKAVKLYFKWLTRENHILYNPASELELPRVAKRLPRSVLLVAEVEAILSQTDPSHAYGLRDRAMLELLYTSGIRRMEAAKLTCHDLDFARGVVFVREGKGGRDRVVPVGARAQAWLARYLDEARPMLAAADTQTLFVTDYGCPATPKLVAGVARRYKELAGIVKPGEAHMFRHACATHMLEGGADIRYIQALLGHTSLQTTEIYTHVSIDKLKAIHTATHPARLERVGGDKSGKGDTTDGGGERQALLSALEADTEEDSEAEEDS